MSDKILIQENACYYNYKFIWFTLLRCFCYYNGYCNNKGFGKSHYYDVFYIATKVYRTHNTLFSIHYDSITGQVIVIMPYKYCLIDN